MLSLHLRRLALAAPVFTLFLACTPSPTPPPLAITGDYGDAPDGGPTGYPATTPTPAPGRFPSLFNTANVRLTGNAGIVHLNANSPLRFGRALDVEPDAKITDADADDGGPTLVIGPLGQTGSLSFNISAPAGNPDVKHSAFANVLLDLNQDGTWAEHNDSGTQIEEWVVKNMPVTVQEGGFERVQTAPFTYGATSARTLLWSRLTLTPTPIDPAAFAAAQGWDGSGPPAGYPEGETEDWFFPCEGSLQITYPLTTDSFGNRLRPVAGAPVARITVTNTATIPVVYVFAARAQVAVPFGLGYFYVDVNSAAPEWTLTMPGAGPGVMVNPAVVTPTPDQQFTIQMAPASVATFNISATLNNIAPILDPTRPPPPGSDNRLGRIMFHPLGPCLSSLTKTNDEPVFLEWP